MKMPMGFDGVWMELGFRWCKQRMGFGGGLAKMGLREGKGLPGAISEQIMGLAWKVEIFRALREREKGILLE